MFIEKCALPSCECMTKVNTKNQDQNIQEKSEM